MALAPPISHCNISCAKEKAERFERSAFINSIPREVEGLVLRLSALSLAEMSKDLAYPERSLP